MRLVILFILPFIICASDYQEVDISFLGNTEIIVDPYKLTPSEIINVFTSDSDIIVYEIDSEKEFGVEEYLGDGYDSQGSDI